MIDGICKTDKGSWVWVFSAVPHLGDYVESCDKRYVITSVTHKTRLSIPLTTSNHMPSSEPYIEVEVELVE